MTEVLREEAYPFITEIVNPIDNTKTINVPIMNIPQHTDKKWEELARKLAVKDYTRIMGQAPESAEAALQWQADYYGYSEGKA